MIRNKLGYILILLFLLFIAILYDEYFTMLVFLAFCLLPIMLFFLGLYVKKHIAVSCAISKSVACRGEKLTVAVTVRNSGLLQASHILIRINMRNRYAGPMKTEEINVAVEAKSSRIIYIDAQSSYCGNIETSVAYVRIYDYLNLWSYRLKLKETVIVSVVPEPAPIEEKLTVDAPMTVNEQEEYSSDKVGDDVSELFGVREYQPGDVLRRIHWKLSAKEDVLLVKEFGQPIDCSTVLMLDFLENKDELQAIEAYNAILTIMLSVSTRLLDDKTIHYVAWYDRLRGECRRMRITSEESMYELLAYLLEVKPNAQSDSIWSMYGATYPYENYSNIFYISSEPPRGRLEGTDIWSGANIRILLAAADGYVINEIELEGRNIPCNTISVARLEEAIHELV